MAIGTGTTKVGRLGRRMAFLVLLLGLLVAFPSSWAARAEPVPPASCSFVLGFATLHNWIAKSEGVDKVGACLENEYHAPNGDGVQWTEGGLLIWRKDVNWTGFTDGRNTWVSGPSGVQKRTNAERFRWEPPPAADPVGFLSGSGRTLPPRIEVDEATRHVLVLHAANGGSTFNLYFGDLGGKPLYAVSLYPDRSVVVAGASVELGVLRRFVLDNLDLLQDPRVSIGTWFDSENSNTYLDISATIPDRGQAVELGKRFNQIAIFDLATFAEIATGGTGETIPNLPAPSERLPPFQTEGQ